MALKDWLFDLYPVIAYDDDGLVMEVVLLQRFIDACMMRPQFEINMAITLLKELLE